MALKLHGNAVWPLSLNIYGLYGTTYTWNTGKLTFLGQ